MIHWFGTMRKFGNYREQNTLNVLCFTAIQLCFFLPQANAEVPFGGAVETTSYPITGSFTRSPISSDSASEYSSTTEDTRNTERSSDSFDNQKANNLLQSGKYSDLISECDSKLESDGECVWARFYRGCALFHQGEYRSAIRDFKQTTADEYYGRTSHIWLGSAFEHLKKFQSSLFHYTEALKTAENDAEVLVSRGRVMSQLSRWQEAIDDYSAGLQNNANRPWTFCYRGFAYAKLGDFDEAMNDFCAAIAEGPSVVSHAYNYRGYIYNQRKEYDLAIEDLNKAIELDPEYAIAYLNRGCVYQAKGDSVRADKDFRKARELDSHLRERRPTLSS